MLMKDLYLSGGDVPRLVAVEGEVAEDGRCGFEPNLSNETSSNAYTAFIQLSCLPPPSGPLTAPRPLLCHCSAYTRLY